MTDTQARRSAMRRISLCKTAAPALLGYAVNAGARAAGRSGLLSRAANWVGSKFGRYGELLRGGNKGLVGEYNAAKEMSTKMMNAGLATRNKRMADVGRNLYADLVSARFGGPHVSRVLRGPNGMQLVTDTAKVLSPETVSELNKVLAARVGTGAGLATAGYLGYKGLAGGSDDGAAKAAEHVTSNVGKQMRAATPYEQGFISKCAELGIDPAVLLKYAGATASGPGEYPMADAWRSLGGLAAPGGVARFMIEDDPTRKQDFKRYVLHATNPDIDYNSDFFMSRLDQFVNTSLREMRKRKIRRLLLDVVKNKQKNGGRGSFYPDDYANKGLVSDLNKDKLNYLFHKKPWASGVPGTFVSVDGKPVAEVPVGGK